MRDIRADLKERLAVAETRRAQATAVLESLEVEVAAIMRLMDIEDRRQVEAGPPVKRHATATLSEFILSRAQTKGVSKEHLRIAALAEGYEVDGRHIHATVTNMLRSGIFKKLPDGSYVAQTKSAEAPAKSASADSSEPRLHKSATPMQSAAGVSSAM